MSLTDQTSGHNLVTKPIERNGRHGMSWSCECGKWKPLPAATSPWGAGNHGPIDAVVAYIRRLHQEHAAQAATDKSED